MRPCAWRQQDEEVALIDRPGVERLEVEDRAGVGEAGVLEASPWHLALIEEDPDRRATLSADLEKDGDYRVVGVSTPPEALGLLDRVPLDVMVTDLTTPDRGLGASRAERLASVVRTGTAMPGVLVVVVLGKEDTALAARAEREGLHVVRTTGVRAWHCWRRTCAWASSGCGCRGCWRTATPSSSVRFAPTP